MFIVLVRSAYKERSEVCKQFVAFMSEWEEGAIDEARLLARIARLFSDRPALLPEFTVLMGPHMSLVNAMRASRSTEQQRTQSVRSGEVKDDDVTAVTRVQRTAPSARLWQCSVCRHLNRREVTECRKCRPVNRAPHAAAPSSALVPAQPASAAPAAASVAAASTSVVAVVPTPSGSRRLLSVPSISLSAPVRDSSHSSAASLVSPPLSSALAVLAEASTSPVQQVTAGEPEADCASDQEPPAQFRPLLISMRKMHKAMSKLRRRLSRSHSLAAPLPTIPPGGHRDLAANQRLCTEVTNQMELFGQLWTAALAFNKTLHATVRHLSRLRQHQRHRSAVLISHMAQLTHTPAQRMLSDTDGRQGKRGKRKRQRLEEEEDEGVGEDERDVDTCPVCLDQRCDALLQPCRHLSCCQQCARRLKHTKKSCPRCHSEIRHVIAIRGLSD